jgi:putative ABC transport system ATP-binding protein
MRHAPIVVEKVSHWFGEGALRRQVLFGVDAVIRGGEVVILTGPSGSGKTTLLTLIGALRSTQQGSLRVLGHELRGAGERTLTEVRKEIGYIFQSHNLLEALSVRQNVEMALQLDEEISVEERERRAAAMLASVGLRDYLERHPSKLSGGQRQRVAIARALVGEPRILLADEPTAALDKEAGRGVVDLIQHLAKERGVTVLLVTHDNRIFDVADRILALEDGRLASFMTAVTSSTHQLLHTLAEDIRKGELVRRVSEMQTDQFAQCLEGVTGEVQEFLDVIEMSQSATFHSMLEQVLEAFTSKLGQIIGAERATLYLVDEEQRELWARVAGPEGELAVESRVPIEPRGSACGCSHCAAHVAATGESVNIADPHRDPLFDPAVDLERGFRTQNLLCVPVEDAQGRVYAVVELANRNQGEAFTEVDERRVREFTDSLGVLLEAWWKMSCACPPLRQAGVASASRPSDRGPPAE